MHRSKFKNYFYKYPSNENFTIVKTKKECLENLNLNDIQCNNIFWQIKSTF